MAKFPWEYWRRMTLPLVTKQFCKLQRNNSNTSSTVTLADSTSSSLRDVLLHESLPSNLEKTATCPILVPQVVGG